MPPGTGTAIRFPSAQRQADLEMVLDGKVPPTGVHLPSFDLSGDPTVLVAQATQQAAAQPDGQVGGTTKTALTPCR
jgi:hypothetical protein